MTTYNMSPFNGMLTVPTTAPPSADIGYGGKLVGLQGVLTYASQASGSLINLFMAKRGWSFIAGFLYTDTSTGSATLAVGNGTIANCFKAAAAITSTDALQWFYSYVGASTAWLTNPLGNPFSADTTFQITTAAASLPSSGNLYAAGIFATP